jgi:hypothetical protein
MDASDEDQAAPGFCALPTLNMIAIQSNVKGSFLRSVRDRGAPHSSVLGYAYSEPGSGSRHATGRFPW